MVTRAEAEDAEASQQDQIEGEGGAEASSHSEVAGEALEGMVVEAEAEGDIKVVVAEEVRR